MYLFSAIPDGPPRNPKSLLDLFSFFSPFEQAGHHVVAAGGLAARQHHADLKRLADELRLALDERDLGLSVRLREQRADRALVRDRLGRFSLLDGDRLDTEHKHGR
jgi:hypothetical protein